MSQVHYGIYINFEVFEGSTPMKGKIADSRWTLKAAGNVCMIPQGR